MRKTLISALLCVSILACKQSSKNTLVNQIQNDQPGEPPAKINSTIYGNYVDEGYDQRAEGSDWVAVSIKKHDDKSILVSVRSRADQKKPTCTFDAQAFKKNENSYVSMHDGKNIIFLFSKESITISTENRDDSKMLYFFCNGGASIAGVYKKINEKLDPQQIDLTTFSKVLHLQGIGFNVSSIMKKGINTMTIFTFGLKKREYNESFNIEGEKIIDAAVEDLNSDGSPELFVYTQSHGDESYGNVYAFSVNNKKSMSQVYFQATSENNMINEGYRGHDEFSVIENSLGHRFPIYREGDTNSKPTGGTRQISYKLVEGEAMRKLEVDKITEY